MIFFRFDNKVKAEKVNECKHIKVNKQTKKKHEQKTCTVKEIINEIKKQYVEWKKIFANNTSDSG